MRPSLALLLIGTRGEMLPRMAEAPVVRRTRPHKSIEARSEATASGVEDARVDAMDKADAHSADSFLENAVGDMQNDEDAVVPKIELSSHSTDHHYLQNTTSQWMQAES